MTPLITLARRFRQWAVLFALVTAAPFSSAQVFAPDGGLWWNPAASGHGYHLAPAGGNLAVVWYSYDSDGRPTWYLAAASLTGSTWTADLQSYHWDGAARAATGTSVGSLTITFSSPSAATLSWDVNGATGSEPIEPLRFADGVVPSGDVTGLWFDAGMPGYGLSVVTQGGLQAAVLYFYDTDGNPRWLLGSGTYSGGPTTIAMDAFTGPCPNCNGSAAVLAPAGTITNDLSGQSSGSFSSAVSLPTPLAGDWPIAGTDVSMLSNPPPQQRRIARMRYDWDNNGTVDATSEFSYNASGQLVREAYVYTGDGTPDADLASTGLLLIPSPGSRTDQATYDYGYDALGRLTSLTITGPTDSSTLSYRYDAGRLKEVEATVDASTNRDAILAELREVFPTLSDDALEALIDQSLDDSATSGSETIRWTLTYTGDQLTSFRMETTNSGIVIDNVLGYNGANQVESRVETTTSRVTTHTYGYDGSGRLTTIDSYNQGPSWVSSDLMTYGGNANSATWLSTSSVNTSRLATSIFDANGQVIRDDYDIGDDGSVDVSVAIEWESASCRRTVFWGAGGWATGDLVVPAPLVNGTGFVYLPGCGGS